MTSALYERILIGARYMLGDIKLRKLLNENFGGKVPQPGTGAWVSFVFATSSAPHNTWIRTWGPVWPKYMALPAPKSMPRFPKALETVDFFMPYEDHRPTNAEPSWIGFWSAQEQNNPYKFPENCNAWGNGRDLATTKNGQTYRAYVEACRKVVRATWGEGAGVP